MSKPTTPSKFHSAGWNDYLAGDVSFVGGQALSGARTKQQCADYERGWNDAKESEAAAEGGA